MKTILRVALAAGALALTIWGVGSGPSCDILSPKACQQCCIDQKNTMKARCNAALKGQELAYCEKIANDRYQNCKASCGPCKERDRLRTR